MSVDKNESTQSSASAIDESNTSGLFIDDYSHLRLSYHREFDDALDFTDSSYSDTLDTSETVKEEVTDERKKLREYWLSQMPDLPHPAVTMAGIISSASKKMGMVQLKYSDKIELGKSQCQEERFSPPRRSTMNCKQLPK